MRAGYHPAVLRLRTHLLRTLLPTPHLVAQEVVELPPCDLPVFVKVELRQAGSEAVGQAAGTGCHAAVANTLRVQALLTLAVCIGRSPGRQLLLSAPQRYMPSLPSTVCTLTRPPLSPTRELPCRATQSAEFMHTTQCLMPR